MTSETDLTLPEDPKPIKENDLFIGMHVERHMINGSHGYCPICNERYCSNEERVCFSNKLVLDCLKHNH